jgi:hypothetical protein
MAGGMSAYEAKWVETESAKSRFWKAPQVTPPRAPGYELPFASGPEYCR